MTIFIDLERPYNTGVCSFVDPCGSPIHIEGLMERERISKNPDNYLKFKTFFSLSVVIEHSVAQIGDILNWNSTL